MGDRLPASTLQFCCPARSARHRCVWAMKQAATAGRKPTRFHDIIMPDDSGVGVMLGAMSFVFADVGNWWLPARHVRSGAVADLP